MACVDNCKDVFVNIFCVSKEISKLTNHVNVKIAAFVINQGKTDLNIY